MLFFFYCLWANTVKCSWLRKLNSLITDDGRRNIQNDLQSVSSYQFLFKRHSLAVTVLLCDIFTLVCFVSLPWRDLLPLSVAFSAPWRWRSSPARLLPWRWLQPGPVCRRRQRRSWRREGWYSRSSGPRSKHPPPLQRPLPTGRRAHDEFSFCQRPAWETRTTTVVQNTEQHWSWEW